MNIAELVSELMYAGKNLSDIAGYDDCQLMRVICRPRDRRGKLKRDNGLPSWVEVDDEGMRVVTRPCSLATAFKRVHRSNGRTEEETKRAWNEYLKLHPKLGQPLGD